MSPLSLLDHFEAVDALVDELLGLAEPERSVRFATIEDPELARLVGTVLASADSTTLDQAADALPRCEASAALDDDARSKSGQRVGAWLLDDVLGEGGMGVVYAAHRADGAYDQRAAVKFVLLSASPEAQRRFERERRLLARIDHPGVARVLDGGLTDGGDPFLVMEFVDGQPITVYADAHRLPVDARLRLFADVCRAVAHAHGRLIVHRDLKPSNVLVTQEGVPKLLDFGVATLAEGDDEAITQYAAPLTPSYASPEQIRGDGATTQSDVYALGVLLYQLLCGARPHEASDHHTLATSVLTHDAPRPSSRITHQSADARGTTAKRLHASLRGDLDAICQRAVAREPARRYASAQALADDLQRHLDGQTVDARPPSLGYRARTFARRNQTGVAFGVLAIVGILLFVGALIDRQSKLTAALATATTERDKANEVSSFLSGLFADADPRYEGGRTVTLNEVLMSASARIDTALADQPVVQAQMQHELGRLFKDLGDYDASLDLHRASAATRSRLFGPGDTTTAQSLREMGVAFQQAGRLDEADSVLQRAHTIFRAKLPSPHFDLAQSYNELGMLALDRRDYAAAETLFAAYRDQHEQMSSSVSDAMGRAYNQNGLTLVYLDRIDESLPILRRARAIWDEVHGPINEHSSTALNNIGFAYATSGRWDSAYVYQSETLRIRQRLYSGDHHSIAFVLLNLGDNRMRVGEHDLADSLLTAGYALYERTVGRHHPKTIQTLDFSIRNLEARGSDADLDRIGPLLDTLRVRQIATRGIDEAAVTRTIRRRALWHATSGRDAASEADFAHVIGRTDDRSGDFHARTLWDRSGVRMQSGRREEALTDLRQAYRIWGELGDAQSVADVEARMAEIEAGL